MLPETCYYIRTLRNRLTQNEGNHLIRLLDKNEAQGIKEVVLNLDTLTSRFGTVKIPMWIAYQGEGTLKPSTKRATCRVCGEKIKEGQQLSFYYDEEQNSWTAKEYHVHTEGCA